uniref:NADH dehydrogenase subunit 6 n=1 Tax=Desmometopa sabroskyi TaxID=3118444 RepID=UPI003001EC5A
MFQLMCYTMIFISSIIFMMMIHPLAMGLMLLIQTLFISLLTGLMNKSFWFSYILFLIFLGGMLVLFIYVTSLASNEMFSISMKLMIWSSIMFITIMMIMMLNDNMIFYIKIFNEEMNSLYNQEMYIMENSLSLSKLYNYPTNMITIMLMNYLLITLIAIVKITKLFHGPLRMMN